MNRPAPGGRAPDLALPAIAVRGVVGGSLLLAWLAVSHQGAVATARVPAHGHAAVLLPLAVAGCLALAVWRGGRLTWWAAAGAVLATLGGAVAAHHDPRQTLTILAATLALLLLAHRYFEGHAPLGAGRGLAVGGACGQVTCAVLGTLGHAGPVPLPFLAAGLVLGAVVRRVPRPCAGVAAAAPAVAARARRDLGQTHISCFGTTPDKRALQLSCGAVVGFRVSARVAICAGDPLAPPAVQPRAIEEFVDVCERRGWDPCFYQTVPALRPAYQAAGLRLVKFGEEAVVDLPSFTLGVPARANLRREVGRARRAGLEAAVLRPGDDATGIHAELEELSGAWLRRHGRHEMGFSLGRLHELAGSDAWLTVVRASSGELVAFSSWLPLGGDGIALDLVRRRPDAAGGAMDLCMAETLELARREGLRVASLGSVPCRDVNGSAPDGAVAHRVRSSLYAHGLDAYRYRSLAHFKDKFAPRWESRDVAFAGSLATPRVVAALVAVHLARG